MSMAAVSLVCVMPGDVVRGRIVRPIARGRVVRRCVVRRCIVRACILLASIAPSGHAGAAGPYKCAGGNGIPVYQQQPCSGEALKDLSQSLPPVSIIPFAQPPPPTPAPRARAEKAPKPSPREKAKVRGEAFERRHVREGASEAEVLARLGTPDMTSGRGRVARWTYLPAPGDQQTITVVRFEDGRVREVERRILR